MSRTDAHAPYWVRLYYEGVESHDHSRGDCDYKDELTHPNHGVGRNHGPSRCKKYTKYTVVCAHQYRMRSSLRYVGDRYVREMHADYSSKRHECWVYNADGDLLKRDLPELPICGLHIDSNQYMNMGDGFDRYDPKSERSRYYLAVRDRTFTKLDHQRATHQFAVYIYNGDVPCPCDDFPARWHRCDKTPRSGDKFFGYSYYCSCCGDERPTRSAVRQALRNIAKYGYDEELDDGYLDFEDVYKGRTDR